MVRRLVSWLIAACMLVIFGQARAEDASKITVEDLRTPHSPAFVLLGIEPSTVERPTNPKALALSAFGALQSGGNFALEVAPYWLQDHPNLTFSDYYAAGVPDTVLQTLSISAGSATNLDNGKDNSGDDTGVATAARFALWRGHPRQSDVDTLNEAGHRLVDLRFDLAEAKARHDDAAVAAITDQMNKIIADTDPVREHVGRSGHLGFSCDVAGGVGGRFPTGESDKGRITSAGVWLTPAYRFEGAAMNAEIIGVARYLRQNDLKAHDHSDVIDVGARITAEFPKILFKSDLALSFEGVRRIDVGGNGDTERFAGIIEYELPATVQLGNAKYLTATFGQDFDDDTGDSRTIALVGLNFSFGTNPKVVAP